MMLLCSKMSRTNGLDHPLEIIIDASQFTDISHFRDFLSEIDDSTREQIVWEHENLDILFTVSNYLSREFKFPFRVPGGWNYEEIVSIICEKYNEMFREEEQICGPSRISSRGKRIPSNGPYGFTTYTPNNLGLGLIYISPSGVVNFETIPRQ